jgi:hypothetical protein
MTPEEDAELRRKYPANVEGSKEFYEECVQQRFREEIRTALLDAKALGYDVSNATDSVTVQDVLRQWVDDDKVDIDIDTLEIIVQDEIQQFFKN